MKRRMKEMRLISVLLFLIVVLKWCVKIRNGIGYSWQSTNKIINQTHDGSVQNIIFTVVLL